MVSRKDKLRATQYISDIIEESRCFSIDERDHRSVLIHARDDVFEEPFTVNVVVPNFDGTVASFNREAYQNRVIGIYTAPVFFKDGKTAFVRMVERNRSWRDDKSLKRYTPREINQMLHLRGIEKAVMGIVGNELQYYQPETDRLPESVREFQMGDVILDYSHISPRDHAYDFVENRISIDYKLPVRVLQITGAAELSIGQGSLAWMIPAE